MIKSRGRSKEAEKQNQPSFLLEVEEQEERVEKQERINRGEGKNLERCLQEIADKEKRVGEREGEEVEEEWWKIDRELGFPSTIGVLITVAVSSSSSINGLVHLV